MDHNARAVAVANFYPITLEAYLFQTFFFGAYTTVFLFTSTFMLSKRPSTKVRNSMLAVTALMYTVSALHWALNMVIAAKSLRAGALLITPFEMLVDTYLPFINYILSDGIVVWRAWVLWGPSLRRTLFTPPILSLMCMLVLSAVGAAFVYLSNDYQLVREGAVSRDLGWTVWGLSVGTNLWATSLICIRLWQHRQAVRSSLGKCTATSKAEKVLFFMVESGALYLCIWSVMLTLSLINWNGTLAIFLDLAIVQVTGIYPLAIVLLVTMHRTSTEVLHQTNPEASEPPITIGFASPESTSTTRDVEIFLESGCDVVSREGGSTGSLVCDSSEKMIGRGRILDTT